MPVAPIAHVYEEPCFMSDFMLYTATFKEVWLAKGAISAVLGYLANELGYSTQTVSVFLFLMLFDFALGVLIGVKRKHWSLRKFRRGFVKIAIYMFTLWCTTQLNRMFQEASGFNAGLHLYFMLYICAIEMLSICTHLMDLGCPLPDAFIKLIKKIRSDAEARLLVDAARRKREYRREMRQQSSMNGDSVMDLLHTTVPFESKNNGEDNPYEPDDDIPPNGRDNNDRN